MKTLREQVGETVDVACGHLDLLRRNLDQVRTLTGDATESISREFQAISDLVGRYQALPPDAGDPAAAGMRDAIAAEIGGRVSALVVLLQFGDIVDQLLKFTDRQAAEVEEYLDGLAAGRKRPGKRGGRRSPEDGGSPRDLRLSDAKKPAAQTSMRPGDVELF